MPASPRPPCFARSRDTRPRLDNRGHPLFAEKVDATIGSDWRRGVVAAEPVLPAHLAGLCVYARGDPAVVHHIEVVTDNDWRGRERGAAPHRPDDAAVGDVAGPFGPNRKQRR